MEAGRFNERKESLIQPTPFVVHGSFNKHLSAIEEAITKLHATGLATVIAPHSYTAIGRQEGFVLLTGEQDKDPRALEAEYLEQVLKVRALGGASLFVVPDGYTGKSVAYEAGIIQACGGRILWTEHPQDVPFYVNPRDVMSVDNLARYLVDHQGVLPGSDQSLDPIKSKWSRLPFPTAYIAVGGIIRYQNRLLIVDDDRWGNQLTIPGTRVRTSESRAEALKRLLNEKIGISVSYVAHLATNFMIPNSGYKGPVDPDKFIFEDHFISSTTSSLRPLNKLKYDWLSLPEIEALIDAEQIELNSIAVLTTYFASQDNTTIDR